MSTTTIKTANPADRRTSPRRQPAVGTICRLALGVNNRPGVSLVWNISHGGVSLLASEPIQPGSAVHGELETLNGQRKLPVDFHVSHLSKLTTGDYCIGARFDSDIDDDAMKPFLGA